MTSNTNALDKTFSFFVSCNDGLSAFLLDEVTEFFGGAFSDVSLSGNVVVFSGSLKHGLLFLRKSQIANSFQILLGSADNFDGLKVDDNIDLGQLISLPGNVGVDASDSKVRLAVSVEEVRGNENRISMGGKISQHIRDVLKKELGFSSAVDYKNPSYQFCVVRGRLGEDLEGPYFLGLRLHSEMLDSRGYRVFHHKVGYKGDFAAAFLRVLGVNQRNSIGASSPTKLAVVCGRDGVFAVEAAFMSLSDRLGCGFVREFDEDVLEKIPMTSSVLDSFGSSDLDGEDNESEGTEGIECKESNEEKLVTFVTSASPSIRSSISNSKVAGEEIHSLIDFHKVPLDEYAFELGQNLFDFAIMRITKKDERDINELYYQLSEVLVPGGRALLIFRPTLELSVSEKFTLVSSGALLRGHGEHAYVLVELNK